MGTEVYFESGLLAHTGFSNIFENTNTNLYILRYLD